MHGVLFTTIFGVSNFISVHSNELFETSLNVFVTGHRW